MNKPALSLADLETYDPHGGRGPDHGKRWRCPVCGDGERSLSVNIHTGLYNCKRASCGARGKLTDFYEHKPSSGRVRASAALKQAFSLAPEPVASVPDDAWRQYAFSAKSVAQHPECPGGDYLANRGILRSLLPRIARGVCYHTAFYGKRPAVLFPMLDRAGEPVAVQARYIDGLPDGHRALGPKGQGAFYTMPDLWQAPVIVLTEAPIDALSLMASGVPAVALGGCSAPRWLYLACALKFVILAFDNDVAGDNAADNIKPYLESYGAGVVRLRPEGVKDWNAMLQSDGSHFMSKYLGANLKYLSRHYFDCSKPSSWWPFLP